MNVVMSMLERHNWEMTRKEYTLSVIHFTFHRSCYEGVNTAAAFINLFHSANRLLCEAVQNWAKCPNSCLEYFEGAQSV